MVNLEMSKNDLNGQINSEQNSKLETKKISRRLFITISLMSLPVVNSINTLKVNKDELTKENIFKQLKLLADGQGSAPGGSPEPSPKGENTSTEKTNSNINLHSPTDKSNKAGDKTAPAPKNGSKNTGGKG